MSSYNRDTEVELTGTFRDTDDNLVDPTAVTCEVRAPGAATVSNAATRASVGVYTFAQMLDASGTWYYRFKGTGTVKVAAWQEITVLDDPLD